MTKIQESLVKILRNRINADIKEGRLETDRENLQEILDMFVAGDKITAEQYAEFTELIAPTVIDNSTEAKIVEPTSETTAS